MFSTIGRIRNERRLAREDKALSRLICSAASPQVREELVAAIQRNG